MEITNKTETNESNYSHNPSKREQTVMIHIHTHNMYLCLIHEQAKSQAILSSELIQLKDMLWKMMKNIEKATGTPTAQNTM